MRSLRAALLSLALVPAALAQLQVLHVAADQTERAVPPVFDAGAASIGDQLDIRFRVRNAGTGTAALTRIEVAGTGFSPLQRPQLPASIPAGGSVDFVVRFFPTGPGSYSAVVEVNTFSFIVRASAAPGLGVSIEIGGLRFSLSTGALIDFGSVNSGTTSVRRLRLDNATTQRLTAALAVEGDGFTLSGSPEVALDPGGMFEFEIHFAPRTIGRFDGALRVGQRRFPLRGEGAAPPFPAPRLAFTPGALTSGQQATVTLTLSEPAPQTVTGELSLEFAPSVSGFPDDQAIQFSSGGRRAPISIASGATSAAAQLQTGTTAGVIAVTVAIAGQQHRVEAALAPATVGITTLRAARSSGSIDLQIAGFDNARSAGQLVFRFFDTAERAIEPPIRVDASEAFLSYFRTSQTGGTFSLRALFPVTGDVADIGSVELELSNSAGVRRSERTRLQ